MPLTILTDEDVRSLLLQLTKQDIQDLQQSLADALHYYSTSTENDSNGCSSSYQPLRTSLKRSDGQTTLLMPASSNDGIGVKIVTLATPDEKTHSHTASITSSLDTLSLSQHSTQADASSTTAPEPPQSLASAQSTTPKGSLTLFDKNGNPRALVNAEEITAFRTALASTMLFKKRQNVHDIVVFGAGKQAYWHIRLALLLRGSDVHHLNIINRDFERVHLLLQKLYNPHEQPEQWSASNERVPHYRQAEGHITTDLPRPKIQILTPGHSEYERLLKSTIRASSVIFFTTPSLTPLFPAPYLTNPEGRKKGRYLAAIGSYKPNMVEIHPDILRQNVAPEHGHWHFHKHAQQAGAVVVDSVEACLKEAGEVIQAGLGPNEVVEIGELLMLKRDAERRRLECQANKSAEGLDEGGVELGECEKSKKKRRGNSQKDHDREDKAHQSLMDWLQKGNVIYKSVGLGLMDVVVGSDLVRLADERGIGTRIENF
ncbi:NAD(P)-binding protein [Cucurbitaria berberidis CBS 394.84]|uniref:NAD(P)-binding protein n=1 Tax=Cucurbitaria berberidis CBS 394.84 TaxID=1168544 RepID=A0A9P4GHS4_9PLEO|nr:NAD(P)-binding protein [Cucurbitaria berberidis CBS 394.84]KAF1845454.1 NAD(P)-binding protein [Cucurbitaria berberidis CBS 394.84]